MDAAPALDGNDEIALALRVWPAGEVPEIRVAEKVLICIGTLNRKGGRVETLADEDVLLVDGVTLAKGLHHGRHDRGEVIITVYVRGILADGVLHAHDDGIVALLGVEHAHTRHVLHGEIYVLECLGTLAARTEHGNGKGHAQEEADKYQYDYRC